jgi:hypothetical protein
VSWFLLALVAPLLWAMVTLVDTYLVHEVFEDPIDGTVISGIFQSVPWLLVPLGMIDFQYPGAAIAIHAYAAGALFLLSFSAYFKALFVVNDGALLQLLWNLAVPAVPFLAWLLIGERLEAGHYLGIGLAFAGVATFGFDPHMQTRIGARIALTMLAAIVMLALSMVASRLAHQLTPSDDAFWSIYLLFCAGASAASLVLLAIRGHVNAGVQGRRILHIGRQHFVVLLLAEALSLVGTLASQGAIRMAPAVSFVAVIESLVPVFVMVASILLAALFRHLGRVGLATAFGAQFTNPGRKTIALILISGGILVIA